MFLIDGHIQVSIGGIHNNKKIKVTNERFEIVEVLRVECTLDTEDLVMRVVFTIISTMKKWS